ncbi:hypothetical protein HOY82DRAFT_567056 [Tuber indicum]|nr:hypothetical protein HOY82DRAFT_567056 [Tuber indicum]
MPPRRTHTKSRAGCAKCKKRRIKCDEVHPSCGNCVKHAIECDFSSAVGVPPAGVVSGASSSSDLPVSNPMTLDASPPPGNGQHQVTTPHQQGIFPQSTVATVSPVINMTDMELIHHWSLSVPSSFTTTDDAETIWRDVIPRLAFRESQGCLVHAMLAISALHLAFIEPDKRSQRMCVAADHYGEAVRGVKDSVGAPTAIGKDNCEGLFVSSTLIVVYAIANPMLTEKVSPPTEIPPWTMPAWLPLIRGVHSILKTMWAWIEAGCLSPLLLGHTYIGDSAGEDEAMNALFRICTDKRELDADEIKDSAVSQAYFGAIHELQKNFANEVALRRKMVSLIFIWPISVSDAFFALLQERRPRALIIFAHYCVLLKRLESFWWVEGRANYELGRIERTLPEPWRKWLEWPVKMIRGG